MSWGFLSWGLSWLGHAVLFNHSGYWSHSATVADWGLPHGGPRAFAGYRGGTVNAGSYGRGLGGYARPGSGDYGGQAAPARAAYAQPAQPQSRMEAYNRAPERVVRMQQSARPAYGPGFASGALAGYGSGVRAGSVYSNPQPAYGGVQRGYGYPQQAYRAPEQQVYRAPAPSLPRGGHDGRAYASSGYAGQSFAGRSYAGEARLSQPKFSEPKYSAPKYSQPKFSAPKFKEPKMASGGHTGGGHSSGKHHG